MKISVFGLGYVGVVNLACLSKIGHTLYGCDVKPHKVNMIREGKSTVYEPEVDNMIAEGLSGKRIFAETSAATCVAETEMALVCVGTPSGPDGEVNLNYILNTAREIGALVKQFNKKYTIVFRSTIPPGTISDHILPELKTVAGDAFSNIKVAFLPEFLREGTAVKDFFQGARIVAGIDEEHSAEQEIKAVFGFDEKTPLIFVDYPTAEFIKYVDNAYHATKVAFANEVYAIGTKLGVNVKTANDVFLMDPILNISTRYLRPGLPFGGSCLPKDSRAIVHLGKVADTPTPFFNGVLQSNKVHQERLLQKLLSFNKQRVFIYGLAFKENTDDIRESPLLFLLKDLVAAGKDVRVYDPKIETDRLRIEFPDVVRYMHHDLETQFEWCEVAVVNKKDMASVLALPGEKTILNCIDNNVYASQGKNVINLF